MSNYGPPGGPYPGRGRDPHEEPYTEPSDPWGDKAQDNWGRGYEQQQGYDQQGYDQGGYDQQGYGGGYDVTGTGYAQRPTEAAPGGWTPAPPGPPPGVPAQPVPPAKRGGAGILVLVAVLVVLVLAGGGTAYYLLNKSGDDKGNQATNDPTPQPAESSNPTPTASGAPNPSVSAAAANDARNVKKGECVLNAGNTKKPEMKIAGCDEKGAYEVLARFDTPAAGEADAQKKCADVQGYTNWYFFNSQLDSLDFVLCLKQR